MSNQTVDINSVTPFFSILIPCYNVEQYIDECVASVESQAFKSWEIIVVDDGSTDGTLGCLEDLKKRLSSKMKLIRQDNSGQLISRRACLSLASGKYAVFLDADDTLRPNALESLNRVLAEAPEALVQFKHSRNADFSGKSFPEYPIEVVSTKKIDIATYKRWVCSTSEFNPLWGKAIPMSVFSSEKTYEDYSHIRNGEDLLQLLDILDQVKEVLLLNDSLYYYRANPKGMASVFQPRFFESVRTVNEVLLKHIALWNDNECLRLFRKRWLTTVCICIKQLTRSGYSLNRIIVEIKKIGLDEMFKSAWFASEGLGDKRDILLKNLAKGHFFRLALVVYLVNIARRF